MDGAADPASPWPASVWSDPRVPEILDIMAHETGASREALVPDATIEALGIPSLDMVQTVFAIESRFDIELPVVAERTGAAEFATVRDLVSHILATIDAKATALEPGVSKPGGTPAAAH